MTRPGPKIDTASPVSAAADDGAVSPPGRTFNRRLPAGTDGTAGKAAE